MMIVRHFMQTNLSTLIKLWTWTQNISYFDIARNFIGVNKITTNSSLTKNKLEKTKVFQEAGQALLDDGNTSIINVVDVGGKKIGDFDADLSITDVPAGTFALDKNIANIKNSHPWISEINKYSSVMQTNECQRQGRCNCTVVFLKQALLVE